MRSAQGPAFTHGALFYEDLPAFLAGTVPFLRAGIAAGEPALVAVDPGKADALRQALPEANGHLRFTDMTELGRNPGRIISAWAEFLREHEDAPRVRGVGEPVWSGRSPEELAECERHESLLNVAFADRPGFSLLCPYDRSRLHESVLEDASSTHPVLVQGGRTVASHRYEAGAAPYVGSLPEPREPVVRVSLAGARPALVRHEVMAWATAAGLDQERVEDLALAVTEAVTNTQVHASGDGRLRLWQERRHVVCEVADRGRLDDPLAGRLPVPEEQPSGRGLWLIHQLCDLVQIRSSDAGTAIRMRMAVPGT